MTSGTLGTKDLQRYELVRFKQGGIGFDSKIVNDFDDAGTIQF